VSAQHTPGPWIVATSNSWRRIVSAHRTESVCEPVKQNDGHPDLYFRNGGADGPDARLIAAAPELLAACKAIVEYQRLAESDETYGLLNAYAKAFETAVAAVTKATGSAA